MIARFLLIAAVVTGLFVGLLQATTPDEPAAAEQPATVSLSEGSPPTVSEEPAPEPEPAPAPEPAEAPPTVTVGESAYGRILFDPDGYALYGFTADPTGESVCDGDCAAAWPPYLVEGELRVPAGVDPSLLGTTERADGGVQLTVAGQPVYYYVGDRNPGDVFCQNVEEFGGLWLVVRPSGDLVT